jgi:hypothetical protein
VLLQLGVLLLLLLPQLSYRSAVLLLRRLLYLLLGRLLLLLGYKRSLLRLRLLLYVYPLLLPLLLCCRHLSWCMVWHHGL